MKLIDKINSKIKESIKQKDSVKLDTLRSIKSAKTRHRDCRVVRRKGRIYVINKTQRRFKARQG